MKLIALMPVRNEDWVLGVSLRVALRWCDAVVVVLHACTDYSAAVIDTLSETEYRRVSVVRFDENVWHEMQHRQAALERARQWGATHIALVDADEILTANLVDRIRGLVEEVPAGSILQLPGYNLREGLLRYHANGIWGRRWFSLAFQDDRNLHWQGDRFHHREPFGSAITFHKPIDQGQGGIMHLWGANERRLRAKHALYKMTETLRWPGKPVTEIDRYYSQSVCPGAAPQYEQEWRYVPTPPEWWCGYEELLLRLRLEAAPWQEAECRRLAADYGRERFAGLDLLGVV